MTGIPARRYRTSEVLRLTPTRHPNPLEPYPIDQQTKPDGTRLARGQGHTRWAADGTRWCPYCQTILTGRARTCPDCRPRRQAALDAARDRAPRPFTAPEQHAINDLVAAVDRLTRTAPRALAKGTPGDEVPFTALDRGVFYPTKDVVIAAEAVQELDI